VISSDALKNAPFGMTTTFKTDPHPTDSTAATTTLEFTPNDVYTKAYLAQKQSNGNQNNKVVNIVKIPKGIVGFVTLGTYTSSCNVEHMPLVRDRTT
jgi:hypothetical protein